MENEHQVNQVTLIKMGDKKVDEKKVVKLRLLKKRSIKEVVAIIEDEIDVLKEELKLAKKAERAHERKEKQRQDDLKVTEIMKMTKDVSIDQMMSILKRELDEASGKSI